MVVATSPDRSHGIDCSVARRAGAIADGPSPVLLPPDGPRDHSLQLRSDAERLRRYRRAVTAEPDQRDWAGSPIHALADQAISIAGQLAPIRTRATLLESYRRESAHAPALRLAYAMVWLALGQGAPDGLVGRRRSRRVAAGRAA